MVLNTQKNPDKIIIGDHTHIRGELFLFGHGGRISIGDHCYIGEQTKIWSAGNIEIGNGVLIAHQVNIHDNISHPLDTNARYKHAIDILEKGHPTSGLDLKESQVIIQDYAWIGFNSSILKGVNIGKGAIVGACSVITKDVPDYAIVVGNSSNIIGYSNPKN